MPQKERDRRASDMSQRIKARVKAMKSPVPKAAARKVQQRESYNSLDNSFSDHAGDRADAGVEVNSFTSQDIQHREQMIG